MIQMKKIKNLSAAKEETPEVDEITMMEARLGLLSKQEQHKIESNMELIKLFERISKSNQGINSDCRKKHRRNKGFSR
jgi:hypothetical protein